MEKNIKEATCKQANINKICNLTKVRYILIVYSVKQA